MIRGVIFDLGSTLIYSAHDQNWGAVMPRMQADLLAHLNARGYALAPDAFFSRLRANYAIFDQQRQTDWVEYTASYLITTTLADLGAPAPTPDLLAEAVRAYFAYSETLYQLMPGAHEALRELRVAGLRLGLISNASDNDNVQRLIDNAGLRGHPRRATGRPAPGVVERARRRPGQPGASWQYHARGRDSSVG